MQRELLLLREMRDSATAIRYLVEGRTVDEIGVDSMRRAAILWHFTVLGEAASQVPEEIKSLHQGIAWTAATRLRNRIVHGYWSIDLALLVDTAADDLPTMIAGLEAAISRSESGRPGTSGG